MARIRTIKPEFPQSESMGRLSRDARLLFVQMWTLADDSGRLRGNSRMLASLLFPYDDDAPALMDGWVGELEAEGCIVRYLADGQTYIEICKWLIHQKIDRPSESKIPPFDESSRILANPREPSSLDQGPGPRIKDQGEDQDRDLGARTKETTPLRSVVATGSANPPPPKAKAKPKPVEGQDPTAASEAWDAYAEAFRSRYGVDPTRNATVNGQLAHLAGRLPRADLPEVIAFFVRENKAWYVSSRHSIGCLLKDAEALHASWRIGRGVTATQATQADRTQTNLGAFGRLIEKAKNEVSA